MRPLLGPSAPSPARLRPGCEQVADAAQTEDPGDDAEPDQSTFHVVLPTGLNGERDRALPFQFSAKAMEEGGAQFGIEADAECRMANPPATGG